MKNIISTTSLILITGMLAISCSATKNKASDNQKLYIPVSQALYDTIMRMDSIVFDAANKGEINKMKALFTQDLEFYHDAGGFDGYAKTMENFQRVATNYGYTRRVIVKESVEVYPIKDYGAIQTGLHKFCKLENGVLVNCGTFKFLHIWKKTATGWKISRVVSYGH